MKRIIKCLALACLLCVLQGPSPVRAENNPLIVPIVGYWVSSSGTPLTIAYSSQADVAWLSINGGPDIKLNVQDRFGEVIFHYIAPDGDEISGHHDASNDKISVSNSPESTFEAVWRRR